MKMQVIISFKHMRDTELDTRAHNIIEKMTGNPNFPTPTPALADVDTALGEYRQALEQAQNGGTDKTVVKNVKRLALEDVLRSLGRYVEANCKNDLAILIGSGFDAYKSPTSRGKAILERPSNFTLVNGPYPGSMKLSVDSVPRAASYMYEYAVAPVTETTKWEKVGATSRSHIIDGLISGQQYAFRVTGIGANATPMYSDVISRFVQ